MHPGRPVWRKLGIHVHPAHGCLKVHTRVCMSAPASACAPTRALGSAFAQSGRGRLPLGLRRRRAGKPGMTQGRTAEPEEEERRWGAREREGGRIGKYTA